MGARRSPMLCYSSCVLTKSMREVLCSSMKCILSLTATSIFRTSAFRNGKSSYSSFPKRIPLYSQKSWFRDHFPRRTHCAMFGQQKITTLSIWKFCVNFWVQNTLEDTRNNLWFMQDSCPYTSSV